MIPIILQSLVYVISDPFFWPAMAFTTIVGIFMGAVIFDGDSQQARKTLFALIFYILLVASVNLSRTLPQISSGVAADPYKPIASVVATILVSIFYLSGVYLGVKIVKRAHKANEK